MTIALLLPLAVCSLQSSPAAAWTEDVLHIVEELERLHPDPFFGCPREQFEGAVDEFIGRVEDLNEDQATVELMRLVARLSQSGREGHSAVWPMRARYLPLQLYSFSDGWFVVDAHPDASAWVGARLVSIGGGPVEEVCRRLAPLVPCDNDWNLRLKLGSVMLCGEVLAGAGIVPDPARISLELAGKEGSKTVELATGPGDLYALFGGQALPARGGAIWLEGHEASWRLQVLEEERALYVQYNAVVPVDHGGQTVADFGKEIVRVFEERGLEKVIVDVRSNGGGNNTTFGPLITALKTPAIDKAGVLFGLIGRGTFSAAGNFVTVLERDTRAILVGEPTGGAPNQYGDAETVSLPHHSDLMVRLATRYHQFAAADDARLTHEPRLAVPLSSADYFAGRDPVLRAALEYRPSR